VRRKLKNAYVLEAMKEAGAPARRIRLCLPRFAGISQQFMADHIGVTRMAITHTMHGTRANRKTQQAIADILQVNREDLFEGISPDDTKTHGSDRASD